MSAMKPAGRRDFPPQTATSSARVFAGQPDEIALRASFCPHFCPGSTLVFSIVLATGLLPHFIVPICQFVSCQGVSAP